jgi:hypothetical protein
MEKTNNQQPTTQWQANRSFCDESPNNKNNEQI